MTTESTKYLAEIPSVSELLAYWLLRCSHFSKLPLGMYSRTNALKSTVLEQLPDDFYKVSMPSVAHNLTFCIKTFESSFNLQVEDLYRNSHPF